MYQELVPSPYEGTWDTVKTAQRRNTCWYCTLIGERPHRCPAKKGESDKTADIKLVFVHRYFATVGFAVLGVINGAPLVCRRTGLMEVFEY